MPDSNQPDRLDRIAFHTSMSFESGTTAAFLQPVGNMLPKTARFIRFVSNTAGARGWHCDEDVTNPLRTSGLPILLSSPDDEALELCGKWQQAFDSGLALGNMAVPRSTVEAAGLLYGHAAHAGQVNAIRFAAHSGLLPQAVGTASETSDDTSAVEVDADKKTIVHELCRILRTYETGRLGLLDPWNRMVVEARDRAIAPFADHIRSLAPEDKRQVLDALSAEKDVDIPWKKFWDERRGLAILYNFSPFTDTGAVVASKRLRERGSMVDVVGCSFANRKKIDVTIERIAAPYIDERTFLDLVPSWATWPAFKAFSRQALAHIRRREEAGKQYEFLYSRAMWAASHYAAGQYKLNHPGIPWTAEFSDPLSLDVEGLPRGGVVERDEFLAPLLDPIEAKYGVIPPEKMTIFGLAEIIPFAMAETVLFTNDFQRETMFNHVYSPTLLERLKTVTEVINHPTLPAAFYNMTPVDYHVDDSKLNLAYFGEFYATRGLTDITTAIRMLPASRRKQVHLHVFTNYIPVGEKGHRPRNLSRKAYDDLVNRAIDGVGAHGIEDQVHLNGSLPYLEFLGVTKQFDYLIVNDARSGTHHAVNPYLPSKWSDYAGSTAKSWAFVEEGSSLSQKPATRLADLGDVDQATRQLAEMLDEKFGRA